MLTLLDNSLNNSPWPGVSDGLSTVYRVAADFSFSPAWTFLGVSSRLWLGLHRKGGRLQGAEEAVGVPCECGMVGRRSIPTGARRALWSVATACEECLDLVKPCPFCLTGAGLAEANTGAATDQNWLATLGSPKGTLNRTGFGECS